MEYRFNRSFTGYETPLTEEQSIDNHFQSGYVQPFVTDSNTERSDGSLPQIIGTMKIEMAKPTSELTDFHVNTAKMIKSAHHHFEDGLDRAQEYLDMNNIDHTIVKSNRYGLMMRDNQSGAHTLVLRGMKPTSPRDILNVSSQTFGTGEGRRMADTMIDEIESAGGSVERVIGFSMGGGDAFDVAFDRGLKATLIDPAINPRHVMKNSLNTRTGGDIEIIRNPENFISVGSAFRNVSTKPRYRVTVVPTGKSGYLSNHELLPNFTRFQHDEAERAAMRMLRVTNAFAEHTTMIDMKRSMNRGESFTKFYRQLNSRNGAASGVDVDIGGVMNRLGSRVHNNAPIVKMWKTLNGYFSPEEQAHLDRAPVSEEVTMNHQSDVVDLIKRNDLDTATDLTQGDMEEAIRLINENEVYSHPVMKNAVMEHISNSVHPVMLTTGLLGSVIGSQIVSKVDPSGTLGQDNEGGVVGNNALAGAITGVVSDVMNTGLSGGTTFVSSSVGSIALISAIGAAAGEATRYGVEKGLEKTKANSDTRKSLSSLAGGAVGGGVAAAATDGLAIGMAAMTGAEAGSLLGPVGIAAGAGIGAVFATTAYAVAKVQHIHSVQKFEKNAGREISHTTKKIGRWFKHLL